MKNKNIIFRFFLGCFASLRLHKGLLTPNLPNYVIPLNCNLNNRITRVLEGITYRNCLLIILWLLTLFIIYIVVYDILYDIFSPALCMGDDIDKTVKDAANSLNASNNTLKVNKPEIHIHNPNIKVPSELGTGLGIGGSVSAGIYALSRSRGVASLPIGLKAAAIVGGGIGGGTAFAISNYLNTMAQKNASNSSNPSTASNNNNDTYPGKSMIEEGDNMDNVVYFLNLDITMCIIMLFLLLLLTYLYVYKRNKIWIVFTIWISTMIISMFSVYLAYSLLEDIEIIAKICHNIHNYNSIKTDYNWDDDTIQFLVAIFIFRSCILGFIYLLLISHIHSIIAKNNDKFIFLKRLWGERLYSYFIKSVNIASKTNWIWMTGIAILLILACLFDIYVAFSIRDRIYEITELYLNSIK